MYTLNQGHWHRETGGGLTKSGASCATGLQSIFNFLWLVLSWKQRTREQRKEKMEIVDQVLTILGQLLQRSQFGFLGFLCGSEFYWSHMAWPLSICIFIPVGEYGSSWEWQVQYKESYSSEEEE